MSWRGYGRMLVTARRLVGESSGCSNLHFSSKGCYAVTESNVFQLSRQALFFDRLTDVLRNCARALLAQVVEAEVAGLLGRHDGDLIDHGRQRLVRRGARARGDDRHRAVAVRFPGRVGKGAERIRFTS